MLKTIIIIFHLTTDRPTDQPTEQPTDRTTNATEEMGDHGEVTLPETLTSGCWRHAVSSNF